MLGLSQERPFSWQVGAFSHGQRECVAILILTGSPEAAYPSILKFLLAGIFGSNGERVVMMQNLLPGLKELRKSSSAGIKVFTTTMPDRPITKRGPEDTISFNHGLTYNLSTPLPR